MYVFSKQDIRYKISQILRDDIEEMKRWNAAEQIERITKDKDSVTTNNLLELVSDENLDIRKYVIALLEEKIHRYEIEVNIRKVREQLLKLVERESLKENNQEVVKEAAGYYLRIIVAGKRNRHGINGILCVGELKAPIGRHRRLLRVRRVAHV